MALSRSAYPIYPTDHSSHLQFAFAEQDHTQLLHLPVSSQADRLINSFPPSSTKASTLTSNNPTTTAPSAPHPLSANLLSSLPTVESQSRPIHSKHHRQSTFSLSSSSKQNLGGLYTLAALARDKTTSAIASLSEPSIRSRRSSNSLYLSAQNASSPSSRSPAETQHKYREIPDSRSHGTPPSTHQRRETLTSNIARQSLLETNPPSQAYADTAYDTPPIAVPRPYRPANLNKMHQTSSRLLRMTNEDRPFTRVWPHEGDDVDGRNADSR